MNRLIPLVLAALSLSACATGDWNRDSIFFSSEMAEARLDQQRQELRSAELELGEVRSQAESLQTAIRRATAAADLDRSLLKQYLQQIERLAGLLAGMREKLANQTSANTEQARIRDSLRQEVGQLQRTVQDLRGDLLLLLENA